MSFFGTIRTCSKFTNLHKNIFSVKKIFMNTHYEIRIQLPPANEVCEGHVFTGVCLSTLGGGMRGCSGGVCMVAPGGVHGCSRGACVVAPGGGICGFLRGACMVFPGGHAWLLPEGGHAWLLPGVCAWFFQGGACVGNDEIRSMSGRYASYWNAFLFLTEIYLSLSN